jgi:hypothetical protein
MRRLHLPSTPAGIDHERALVAETAIEAAGGGRLTGLHRDGRDPLRWTATVRREHDHVVVVLDARLGTVAVQPAAGWTAS